MTLKLSANQINDFSKEVKSLSGIKLKDCYQCGKCSASCPMTFQMDYPPNKIIRLAQLGQRETVITSSAIWVCVSCVTCTARCPKDIDIAGLMDIFRELSIKEEKANKEQIRIQTFHKLFLKGIRSHGRLYELMLIAKYKLSTLRLFQDVAKTPKMLFTGKLKFLPHGVNGKEEIKKIFEKTLEK